VIVGHEQVVARLQERLPAVSLFQGPVSVGKWSAATELVGARVGELRTYERLDADASRDVVGFLGRRSFSGSKGVVARLDGASSQALNGLLKTLESPPARSHVLLCSATRPMLTVASRASRYPFGYLTETQVAQVLIGMGWAPIDAEWAAARSGGQVARALDAVETEKARQAVLSLLHGAADGDVSLLTYSLVKFGPDPEHPDRAAQHLEMLRRWATEARTGRWRVFTAAESYGLHADTGVVDRVLQTTASGARPRVAARAALLAAALERARERA
jgi:hypothetical protein